MRWRLWGSVALALLLCVAFLRFCVRFLPADAPSKERERHAPVGPGPLLVPVEGVPPSALTDTFSQSRAAGARRHDAIDILAPRGTAVLAASDGPVEKIFWSEAGGRTLYQRSPDGRLSFYYAHLDGYAPGLREGAMLKRGQRIATVGSTGNADPSAPHLHFAVHVMAKGDPWHGGRAVNPWPLLTAR
ncbi:M23 family peptidase [Sphingobium amiense]|uniref:M23 family peptidase n=1 Tax=Sphingobium amiense TaxID=135719 RepID=A0A494W3K5_9SPHN|nr:M23 family metallopeptidase [Sphingobium amiense]BBD97916.1 M23 family peptidase [Sphingobium amiense]